MQDNNLRVYSNMTIQFYKKDFKEKEQQEVATQKFDDFVSKMEKLPIKTGNADIDLRSEFGIEGEPVLSTIVEKKLIHGQPRLIVNTDCKIWKFFDEIIEKDYQDEDGNPYMGYCVRCYCPNLLVNTDTTQNFFEERFLVQFSLKSSESCEHLNDEIMFGEIADEESASIECLRVGIASVIIDEFSLFDKSKSKIYDALSKGLWKKWTNEKEIISEIDWGLLSKNLSTSLKETGLFDEDDSIVITPISSELPND